MDAAGKGAYHPVLVEHVELLFLRHHSPIPQHRSEEDTKSFTVLAKVRSEAPIRGHAVQHGNALTDPRQTQTHKLFHAHWWCNTRTLHRNNAKI